MEAVPEEEFKQIVGGQIYIRKHIPDEQIKMPVQDTANDPRSFPKIYFIFQIRKADSLLFILLKK